SVVTKDLRKEPGTGSQTRRPAPAIVTAILHLRRERNPAANPQRGSRNSLGDFSFPGSAWERPAREPLPRLEPSRQSPQDSAFPGGAWEREPRKPCAQPALETPRAIDYAGE